MKYVYPQPKKSTKYLERKILGERTDSYFENL